MPINILMPALSPTMEKGNLAKWLKKEGDAVKAGDVIAEIETDKATMEFEAVDEGTIGKILVPEGTQDVAINAPIAVLLEEGEDKSAIKDMPAASPSPGPSPAASGPPSPTGERVQRPRQPPRLQFRPPSPRASPLPWWERDRVGGKSVHQWLCRPHHGLAARPPSGERGRHRPRAGQGQRPARPRREVRHRRRQSGRCAGRGACRLPRRRRRRRLPRHR